MKKYYLAFNVDNHVFYSKQYFKTYDNAVKWAHKNIQARDEFIRAFIYKDNICIGCEIL